jgi:hypothetical protein
LFIGLPALAQITGGHETVQDAIRFERQKDAADARQARIEAGREANSSADRSTSNNTARKSSKTRKGSASRTKTTNQQQQQ